jgi:hypothetical protein
MKRLVGPVLALAIALCLPCAYAQIPPQLAEAEQHFERAQEWIRQQRWSEAISELEAARRLADTSRVLYELGRAQRALGHHAQAIAAYREFLRRSGELVAPAIRDEVQAYLRDAVGHLTLRVEPLEATVTIDGTAVPPGTTSIEVDPGRHLVGATARGFRPALQPIEVATGAIETVTLRLEMVPVTGRLHVQSSVPSAMIWLDGEEEVGVGSADCELRPGRHIVRVSAAGYQQFREEISVTAGEVVHLRPALVPIRSGSIWSSPWLWAGIGVVVVVVGGVAAGVAASMTPNAPYNPPLGTATTALQRAP